MEKEGLLEKFNKYEIIEVTKRFSFMAACESMKYSSQKCEISNAFIRLTDAQRINWLIYELSKLNFLSKGRDTDWELVEMILKSQIMKKTFNEETKDNFIGNILPTINVKSLKNRRSSWIRFCRGGKISKDFYSHSKISKS